MSKAIDELVGKLRELLAESNDDVLAKMRTAAEEMLGPEDHGCWFDPLSFDFGNMAFRCSCGKQGFITRAGLVSMYNATRHLTVENLQMGAEACERAGGLERLVAISFRAAAAAMRKTASK